MPTPTKGRRLGGSAAHQQHMLANLATALFEHGRITTTEARARRLRPVAERLITFAKRGDLHARRQVLTMVTDKTVIKTLFDEIGPGYASRAGGYTRITKIAPRKGDNAAMAVIELVAETVEAKPQRRRARRAQPAGVGRQARQAAPAPADAEQTAAAEEPAEVTVGEVAAADAEVPGEAEVAGAEERRSEAADVAVAAAETEPGPEPEAADDQAGASAEQDEQ